MRSINFYINLFLLGVIGLSSCKKDQTNNEEPYSSISNLNSIAISQSNVYYCEPVKTLNLEDGYLVLSNIHYNNGDIGIQYNKLDLNQEVIWSKTYSDGGYQYKGADLIQVQNSIYIAMNFGLDLGGSMRIKLLRIDMNGSVMQEKSIPNTIISHSYSVESIAYDEGNTDIDPSLILTGETTNVDVTKPEYSGNIEYDLKDIYTASLNPNLKAEFGIYWESFYGHVRNDKGARIITLEDGYIVGGTAISRFFNTDYVQNLTLVKYKKESGNIINIQQYTVSGLKLEWIDMVYDMDRQQIHLFAYDPNATTATIYKISVDNDFQQIGDTDIIDLVNTETITYHSVNLLSNGKFLLTLEKPNNEDTQNLEWITFTINGSVENRYTFNDPEQKYIESVGSLSEANSEVLSIDHLIFPISYQNNKSIGTYKLNLDFPIQN